MNTNPMDDYLRLVGQGVLQQQLDQLAQQQPPLTTAQAQAQTNSKIAIDRQRREVEQARDKARAKKAEMEKARAAAFQEVEKQRVEQEKESFRKAQLTRWLGTETEFNRHFDKLWDDERIRRLQQESSDIERTKAQMRARNPDGYIF